MRRLSFVALLVVSALTLSSCAYYQAASKARADGAAKPWWCTSTEDIPVTDGPAVGTVDWYADVTKAPIAWDECIAMSIQFDASKKFVEQWPTRGAGEAAGFREVTGFIPGMGTHHVKGGITPAMLADPNFNRQNPILDNAGLDNKFDPAKPEVLQFDGNNSSSRLVGFDYYVRTSTGLPPAGFPGNIDWWHHHPWICHRRTDAAMIMFNASDAACASGNGVNVNYSNYYMLHVWVLDDMKYIPDVFAGQVPCIQGPGTGTIHDNPNHWCHFGRSAPASATATAAATRNASTPILHPSSAGPGLVCPLEAAATAS
jgi:hypothetical protein